MSNEKIQHGRKELIAHSSFELYDQQRLAIEMPMLLPQLTAITTDALGKTPEDMEEVAREWEEVIVVKEGRRIVGYGGYVTMDIPGVGKVLHESGKMVKKNTQGKQYGSRLTSEALHLHRDADYFTFTSQNPREIQSVRRALDGRGLAPIDVGYTEDQSLHESFRQVITQTGKKNIDLNTGVRPGLYAGERFGNYEIDLSHPQIQFIETRLRALSFDRDAGDGVFFMAKLK